MKLNFTYLYAFILFVCFATNVSGQSTEQKTDSLLSLIENTAIDTVKVKHYIDLGAMYLYREPNKASTFFHKGLAISTKVQFYYGLGESYSALFNVHYVLASHSDSMLVYVKLREALYEKTGDIRDKVEAYWNYGLYYRHLENNDKAIKAYLKALELVKEHNLSKLQEAKLLGNIGVVLYVSGDYEEALKYYKQAAPLFVNNKGAEAIAYFNIGQVYSDNLNKVDTALQFFNKAYVLAEEVGQYSLMVRVLIEQGWCHDTNGNYEMANAHYQNALQVHIEQNLGDNFATIFTAFSSHYLKRKQYRRSIEYSEKAIQIVEETKDYTLLSELYETQEAAYAAIGDYKSAYEVKTKLTNHLDSLNSVEVQGNIKELQTKYEVEQKEAENKLLKSQKIQDQLVIRQRTIVGVGVALILLLLAAFLRYSNQQRRRQNEQLEQKVIERTVELQTANKNLEQANYELRTFNYIASHDIKEPIRNIGSYVGLIRRRLPNDLKESLSDYFDTIKRSTNQLYTLIEDFAYYSTLSKDEIIETESVDLNLLTYNVIDNLQKSVKKYNGKVLVNNLPTIDSSNAFLFTALKNLIENGLKYNESEIPTINIDYNKTEIHHEIIVSDNGIGIDQQYHERVFEMFKRLHNRGTYEGSGIGLAIVKLSVEKLGGTIELESEIGKGSQFVIRLPF